MYNRDLHIKSSTSRPPEWHLFVPKLYTVLRQGYSWADLRHDTVAGLTVAIVALPLAMALAIASGATPDKGLITAIIAGFLISALGGSRFQIGGPTGAFVVVVFDVISRHGYDGLIMATILAGFMLIIAGIFRLGTFIKYIPQPVVTGFTTGIAVIIFSSQMNAFFGFGIDGLSADVLGQWQTYFSQLHKISPVTLLLAAGTLALIILLRNYAPKAPGFLIALTVGAAIAPLLGLSVSTIGSQFGDLPHFLPAPSIPTFNIADIPDLLPSAATIAFLAGVESLLSAVVADGMTGRRHRSNCELVAQGVANMASGFFGGLPATGAIARTATNIKSGGRTPVSGMLHAAFLLLIMFLFAPLAGYVPLACLAAVLVIVAWNMSEIGRFAQFMSAPIGDRLVLISTFLLTVLVDLTVAIEVGVVMSALVFMHRMAGAVEVATHVSLIEEDHDDLNGFPAKAYIPGHGLPDGVETYEITGPFFFGTVSLLVDVLERIDANTKIIILRLRNVPLIDATGTSALADFISRSQSKGRVVILSEPQPSTRELLHRLQNENAGAHLHLAASFDEAKKIALAGLAEEPE
ncbi:STAS domain-containing protein [Sneathiella sp. CAU 1612]|uniref:STAS domain-containing protein n=1 Tax=Sneathiella sedimenti TaxID=2816034 RepID=A0ABS3F3Q2_9PROT|nr:SulP family inorganic anion transporter [Sneathiella sedimenti]MBO0332963.1 STAS domain-containing protein [Sneathiella sedimenti]